MPNGFGVVDGGTDDDVVDDDDVVVFVVVVVDDGVVVVVVVEDEAGGWFTFNNWLNILFMFGGIVADDDDDVVVVVDGWLLDDLVPQGFGNGSVFSVPAWRFSFEPLLLLLLFNNAENGFEVNCSRVAFNMGSSSSL